MTITSTPSGLPRVMRAFAIDRFGDAGAVRELPIPELGPEEMLVRVRAAGVNPLDLKIRDGGKVTGSERFPMVLGQDAAGFVVAVGGNAAARARIGAEVYGAFWGAGTFAEYVRVPVKAAIASKPPTIDFVQAAALPTPALAAVAALEAVALRRGETVLIVGATGSVGSYAVQMATRLGARVIATAHPRGEDYVRKLGAMEVIDYTRDDVVTAVKRANPAGLDALVDVVSDRPTLGRMADVLRAGGRLASSVHSADEAGLAARGLSAVNIDVLGSTEGLDDVTQFVGAGGATIPVERTYPLEAAGEALASLKGGRTRGKIVLTVV